MNPELPRTPREELEASLTALLFGELPPEKAAALREVLAHDVELAKLHERLKLTMRLVAETAASPAAEAADQPEPLQLGAQRRQKLLASFKTVKPKEFQKPPRRRVPWLVPVAIAAALVAFVSILVPASRKRFMLSADIAEAPPAAIVSQDAADSRALDRAQEHGQQASKKLDVINFGLSSRRLSGTAGKPGQASIAKGDASTSDLSKKMPALDFEAAQLVDAAPPPVANPKPSAVVLPSMAESADADKSRTLADQPQSYPTGPYYGGGAYGGYAAKPQAAPTEERLKEVADSKAGATRADSWNVTANLKGFYDDNVNGAPANQPAGAVAAAQPAPVQHGFSLLGPQPNNDFFAQSDLRSGKESADEGRLAGNNAWFGHSSPPQQQTAERFYRMQPGTPLASDAIRAPAQQVAPTTPSGYANTSGTWSLATGNDNFAFKVDTGGATGGRGGAGQGGGGGAGGTPSQPESTVSLGFTTGLTRDDVAGLRHLKETPATITWGEADKDALLQTPGAVDPATGLPLPTDSLSMDGTSPGLTAPARAAGRPRTVAEADVRAAGNAAVKQQSLTPVQNQHDVASRRSLVEIENEPVVPTVGGAGGGGFGGGRPAATPATPPSDLALGVEPAKSAAPLSETERAAFRRRYGLAPGQAAAPAVAEGKQPLEVRTFQVDPNALRQGLANAAGPPFGGVQAGGFGGGGAGGRDQNGGQGTVARVELAGGAGSIAGGGMGGGGGISGLTRTNATQGISEGARQYYSSLGVDLSAPGRNLFWNDRTGTLMVRGTAEELETIAAANQALNQQPPETSLQARFAETTQSAANALQETESKKTPDQNGLVPLELKLPAPAFKGTPKDLAFEPKAAGVELKPTTPSTLATPKLEMADASSLMEKLDDVVNVVIPPSPPVAKPPAAFTEFSVSPPVVTVRPELLFAKNPPGEKEPSLALNGITAGLGEKRALTPATTAPISDTESLGREVTREALPDTAFLANQSVASAAVDGEKAPMLGDSAVMGKLFRSKSQAPAPQRAKPSKVELPAGGEAGKLTDYALASDFAPSLSTVPGVVDGGAMVVTNSVAALNGAGTSPHWGFATTDAPQVGQGLQNSIVTDESQKLSERVGKSAAPALSITDSTANSGSASPLITAETLRHLEALQNEGKVELARQEALRNRLKAIDHEQLVQALPGTVPDPLLSSLLDQERMAGQRLEAAKKELGPESAEVGKAKALVGDLQRKVAGRAGDLMLGLDTKVDSLRNNLRELDHEITKAKESDVAKVREALPYLQAKKDLEELQQFRQILSMKIASEGIDTSLPKSAMVEIIDRAKAEPAQTPGLLARLGGTLGGKVERSTRLRVERDSSDISGISNGRTMGVAYDPYFIQTESEAIKSEAVLGKVIKDLKLDEAWAKKNGSGGKLSTTQTLGLLKKSVDLHPVPNTSLLEIRAKSDQPEEAARIANAVADAYQAKRKEEWEQKTKGGIQALEEHYKDLEQKVAEAQKKVDALRAQSSSADAAPKVESKPAEQTEPDVAKKARPSAPAAEPQPEVQSTENAFSTFSLNVSDVSFKLAAASLEKGQMPDAASVRSEEFINAFDYRDPEPAAGVPIAFAWERARYPYAQSRDLLRFSVKTAALGRQPGRPLNLVLLLDNSGSMERADRVSIIHEALRVLAAQLQPQDKFSVVTFARTARLWVDGVPGNQAAQAAEEMSKLTPQGGTNLEDAMNTAYATALRHYLANGVNRVVLLTDGAANLGDVEPADLKQKVESYRKQGVALDCFGIGWEGYNDDLLEELSRNGDGRYGFINTPEEAATEFAGQLAGALHVAASDVKVQVEFNPRRVRAYRQIGYAKHQLTKEQFRDNTVDAAELGAAEAGNALYVIDVNPGGEGPVATVRARYKVPGTSEYHEHEWAVPYHGNAVGLELATPAMRLAGAASAFSEWLVSSPYAGEVSPDSLLSYLRGVPEIWGADARPKKLEWMIRQAKSIAGK